MKKKLLLFIVTLTVTAPVFATKWTVSNSGFSFSPSTLTIQNGDTVIFTLQSSHDPREVSQSTYNANGTTALNGGFQTAFSGGMVLPEKLGPGTHYYVCSNHASMGMKGTITVVGTGIVGVDASPQIVFYPNPVKDQLEINIPASLLSEPFDLAIFNLKGELVYQTTVTLTTSKVSCSDFKPGWYLVKLANNGLIIRRKLMIE